MTFWQSWCEVCGVAGAMLVGGVALIFALVVTMGIWDQIIQQIAWAQYKIEQREKAKSQ